MSSDSSVNYTFMGTFAFKNNNYFKVHWHNPEFNLYWIPTNVNGQIVLEACSGSASDPYEACEFYVDGYCAINIGEFTSTKSFSTTAMEKVDEDLTLVQNSNQVACASQMVVASRLQGSQLLYSRGSVKAKAAIRNFGEVHVDDEFYSFTL